MSLTSLSQTLNTNFQSNTVFSNSKLEETPLEKSEGCQLIEESSPVICSNINPAPVDKPSTKDLTVVKETTSDNIDRASNEEDALVEDFEPVYQGSKQNSVEPQQPSAPEPPKKSMPYNENMTKTFESSEFDLSQSAALPGMIFGG